MVPLGLVTVKVTSTSAPSIESQDPIRGGSFGRGELSVGSGSPLSHERCGRRSGGGVGSITSKVSVFEPAASPLLSLQCSGIGKKPPTPCT